MQKLNIMSLKKNDDGFIKRYISKSADTLDDELINDEIYNLMVLARNAKTYSESLRGYDAILKKHDYYKALNEKGFVLINLKEFDKAIDCFNKSLQLTKNNYDAHIGNAIAYSELLNFEDDVNLGLELEMRANLKIACILNEEGFYLKYKLFKQIGDYEGAFKSLNNYLKFNPPSFYKDQENFLSLFFDQAELNFLLGNISQAFHMFHQYLRFNCDDINALMYMAMIAPYFSKYDCSFKCIDKVFEMDNTNFDVILLKAELLIYLNRYEEAIDYFYKCPINEISNKYEQLLNHAKNQIGNETNFFGVSKVKKSEYNYVYTYYDEELRKIYAENLDVLRLIMFNKGVILHEIVFCEDFTKADYINAYLMFPDFPTEYNELISSILNSVFIKDIEDKKIDREKMLESKSSVEQEIIGYLIDSIEYYFRYSRKSNRTGIFGVSKINRSFSDYHWKYTDYLNHIKESPIEYYACNLDELESIVKREGLFWCIYDDDLVKKARKRDFELINK